MPVMLTGRWMFDAVKLKKKLKTRANAAARPLASAEVPGASAIVAKLLKRNLRIVPNAAELIDAERDVGRRALPSRKTDSDQTDQAERPHHLRWTPDRSPWRFRAMEAALSGGSVKRFKYGTSNLVVLGGCRTGLNVVASLSRLTADWRRPRRQGFFYEPNQSVWEIATEIPRRLKGMKSPVQCMAFAGWPPGSPPALKMGPC